jgi:hypothetical protein
MWSLRALATATALAVSAVAPAFAMTVRLADLRQLVGTSHLVVRATVLAGARAALEGSRIVTRTPVAVSSVWAGAPDGKDIVEVVTLGGVVGDVGQHVSGMPSLAAGEDVVLMLACDEHGRYHPIGAWQGVFHVAAALGDKSPVVRWSAGSHVVGAPVTMPADVASLERAVRELAGAR